MVAPSNNEQIVALLDAGTNELSSVDDVVEQLNQVPSNLLSSHLDHRFYAERLFPRLDQILKQWDRNQTTLNENDSVTLYHASNLILRVSNSMSDQLQNNKTLLGTVQKCLNNISSYGYYIFTFHKGEDPNLSSFDRLIQAYANANCKPLVKHVSSCATSRFYAEALSRIDGHSLTNTEHFLLVTCPDYVLKFDKENGKYARSILDRMVSEYAVNFARYLWDINNWTDVYLLCLISPFRLIACGIRSLELSKKEPFVNIVIKILEHGLICSNLDSNEKEALWTMLVHLSLRILLEIARSEPQLLNEIRENKESLTQLLDTLQHLSNDGQNENGQLHAFELIALIVSDKQFSQMVNANKVVELFLKKFNEAIEDDTAKEEEYKEKVEELQHGLTNLMQNNDIREQLVEQNRLPLLIQYAKKSPNNAFLLEIIYATLFTTAGKEELKKEQYADFIDHVKQLRQSGIEQVQQAAHGIMWKLEEEDKFKEASEQREKEPPKAALYSVPILRGYNFVESPPMANVMSMPDNYHVMISYCWANKPLCRQIYERLQNDGYRVWLDENEMHGSIIERMAEGIEKSEFVLICMSSGYKKSPNCQAEAEYAFNRKRKIVPLILEPKYKADGWLGFIVGNRIYVDFANKEAEEFEKTYKKLLIELQRNGLELIESANNFKEQEHEEKNGKEDESQPQLIEKEKVQAQPKKIEYTAIGRSPPQEYRRIERINDWSEQHVIEFLIDNNLNRLLSVLRGVDGQGLFELNRVYERSPENLFKMFSKDGETVSLGVFFKFIGALKKYLLLAEQSVYF